MVAGFRGGGEAIRFEKQLKRWRRDWRVALIEAENPAWGDLYPGLIGPQLFGADAIAAIDAYAQRHPGRSRAESRDP